jgi:hypothetical protein
MKKTTWGDVKAACKVKPFFYLSLCENTGKRVLRCNNGWIQSRRPDYAMAIIRNAKID